MAISRRAFLSAAAGAGAAGAAGLWPRHGAAAGAGAGVEVARAGFDGSGPARTAAAPPPDRFDPWLEVDASALRRNAAEVARLAGGRPILAVVKNNGYGLGLGTVAAALDAAPEVAGLAVVKADEAMELRHAGATKPILLMGPVDASVAAGLVRRDVALAPFTDDARATLERVATEIGSPVPVHFYVDTGMNRLGMPFHRALPWMAELASSRAVRIEGTFMTFTESDDYDPEQAERFRRLVAEAGGRGIPLGRLHAASSNGLFFRRDALLDMVRPGLALYGAYPAGATALGTAELTPAVRLRARVARVERLRPGDSVSYGRNYVADRPVWAATIPVGHADGYHRTAVNGCRVLIGGRTYPVIGAVSASHTIVEIGDDATVRVGDVATVLGPDHAEIHPNRVAERAGISVYDVLMRLSAKLPVRIADPSHSPAT